MPDPPAFVDLPFVDIHCHLLPKIDDGSAGWDETLAMARLAVDDGISSIIATPHQLGSHGQNHGDAIRAETARLQQFLRQHDVPLRVLPGADVRIEPEMIAKLQSGEVLTLADRRRHVLLELPHDLYLPLEGVLSDLHAIGMVGILSHPERNLGVLGNRRLLRPLVEAGCLLQVTAGAVVGTFGPEVQKLAQWLIQQRLVHFIATDAHGAKSRRPLIRRAFDRVARLIGESAAVDLCCRNPAVVADGKAVAPPSKRSPGKGPGLSGIGGWFRRKKAG